MIERTGNVGIGEKTLYGEENGEDVISGRPFLSQYVQAYVPVFIDVRMETRGLETDTGCSDGIAIREFEYKSIF